MINLIFEKITDTLNCNVNNIWENEIKPADYYDTLSKTQFDKYVSLFHKDYKTVNLISQFSWMKEASDLNNLTGTVSKLFDDEINKLPIENSFDGNPYFVRTNNVSLKTGLFGAGPFYTLKEVVIGIITSSVSHDPLNGSGIYYLLKWVDLVYFLEFRVFVYSGNITAISQQHLYETPKKQIVNEFYILRLVEFYKTIVKNRIKLDTYSFDVGFTSDDSIYFIECNCFGASYAAGSALFHWIDDSDILKGNGSTIVVRFR